MKYLVWVLLSVIALDGQTLCGAQASAKALEKLSSTLAALQHSDAPQTLLSGQLTDEMMSLAERDHQAPRPVVASFADRITKALIGRKLSEAGLATLSECIVDAMRRGTSNAGLASRLRREILDTGVDTSETTGIVTNFIAVREAIQGPDDAPLVK